MSAEADAVCGAEYGERSDERINQRNGYRARERDTRAGTVELAIPKLRHGSYFPDWLLQHRRRAEQALVSVVATAYTFLALDALVVKGQERGRIVGVHTLIATAVNADGPPSPPREPAPNSPPPNINHNGSTLTASYTTSADMTNTLRRRRAGYL